MVKQADIMLLIINNKNYEDALNVSTLFVIMTYMLFNAI